MNSNQRIEVRRGHVWKMEWPGNFCIVCGMDDPYEVALANNCMDCQLFAEEGIILCPKHQAMADTPCK